MYKRKKRNVYLAISILITIIIWVGFDAMRAYNKSSITPDVTKALIPLDPRVDQKIFTELERRHNLTIVQK